MKLKSRVRYRSIKQLSVQEMLDMFDLFEQHYHRTSLRAFLQSLDGKTGVFVVSCCRTGRLMGFSTFSVYPLLLGGKLSKGLISGDTVIEEGYRGEGVLQMAVLRRLLAEALKTPFTPQFWIQHSKGYKPYLLMSRNFSQCYPVRSEKHPHLRELVIQYCEHLYPGKLDLHRMLLDFGPGTHRLKEDAAPITARMCDAHPDIRYFQQRNPTWMHGTELPCIACANLPALIRDAGPVLFRTLKALILPGRFPDTHVQASSSAEPRT